MDHRTDSELLTDYVESNSDAAFAEIVQRYAGLVHSAAIRQVGDPHLAQDVTQAVFLILSRKASKLPARTVLPGWLCRTAHFAARDAVKTEARRRRREQEAAMNSSGTEYESAWEQLAPVLDEAIAQLREVDRNAIVLRYFSQQPLEQVGVALGIGTEAAQKRVGRALEKLRKIFARRGVVLTATAIAGGVSACSVQAAPPATVAAVMNATNCASTLSPSVAAIVKRTLNQIIWTKLKIAASLAAVVVGIGAGAAAIHPPVSHPETDGFIIRGNLTWTTPRPFQHPSNFEIKVQGCRWQLKTWEHENEEYYVNQYDGENLLWYHDPNGKPGWIKDGLVESTPVPEDIGDSAYAIWFACASGCYLTGRTNGDILSYQSVHYSNTSARVKIPAEWECLPGSLNLPKHCQFYKTNFQGNTFPAAEFSVLTVTNIRGETLPLTFQYRISNVGPMTSPIPGPPAIAIGTISQISEAHVMFDPAPVPFEVQDIRNPNASAVYILNDQNLPALKHLPALSRSHTQVPGR